MSIDANITAIERDGDGDFVMKLHQPNKTRIAGRRTLIIMLPIPDNIYYLVGKKVWGGADSLMCGEIEIGKRIGYTRVRLSQEAIAKVQEQDARRLAAGAEAIERMETEKPEDWDTL